MPRDRKLALKENKFAKRIEKRGDGAYSKSKKDKKYTVGPALLALFLFVVVGSAVIQVISAAQKGVPGGGF